MKHTLGPLRLTLDAHHFGPLWSFGVLVYAHPDLLSSHDREEIGVHLHLGPWRLVASLARRDEHADAVLTRLAQRRRRSAAGAS